MVGGGRLGRVGPVGMVADRVEDRLVAATPPVGEPHLPDELARRVRDVAPRVREVVSLGRGRGGDQVHLRPKVVEDVPAVREELDVGGRRRARTQLVELGLPEVALVRLVPDDQVFDGRVALDEVRRIRAIVVPGRLVEWRGVRPTVEGHDEPFGSSAALIIASSWATTSGGSVRAPGSHGTVIRKVATPSSRAAGRAESGSSLNASSVRPTKSSARALTAWAWARSRSRTNSRRRERRASEKKDKTPGHVSSTLGSLDHEAARPPPELER